MARLIVAVLFFAIPLAAQQPQQILPDAPQPKIELTSSAHRNPRIFWTGVSLLAASTTADAITARQGFNRGESEIDPVFGKHPSAGRQAAINALFFAGQSTLFYETEKNRRWYVRWGGRAFIGLVIADHVHLAVCNSKINPLSLHVQSCHEFLPL